MRVDTARLESALAELDEFQFKAATHQDGNAVCLSGPGSGKTSTIVARYAWLAAHKQNVSGILCVTFSVAAAAEMRKRIRELLGWTEMNPIAVSTFHAQALRIITAESSRLPFKMLADPIAAPRTIKKILREIIAKGDDMRSIVNFIGLCRRSLLDPDTAKAEAATDTERLFAFYYAEYDKALKATGLVDFDSMVYLAVKQLESNTESRDNWCYRYSEVIIDEAHDTSADQAQLARLLSSSGRLWVAGDTSQKIYGFRGASNELLLPKDEKTKTYFLGNNYRSLSNIVDAFKPFGETDELSKKLVDAIKPVRVGGGTCLIRQFRNEDEECNVVTASIAEQLQKLAPTNFAILSRTRSFLSAYSDSLSELGIPYRWIGKNFWKSIEVQDALAFARLALNPSDLDAFTRVICSGAKATKFLGAKFAADICSRARSRDTNRPKPMDLDVENGSTRAAATWDNARIILRSIFARNLAPADFFFTVMKEAGFSSGDDDFQDSNHDEFRAENVISLAIRSRRFNDLGKFLNHADHMARMTSNAKGVTLSTIHGAKGLEWKTVYVIAFNEGIIPHSRSRDRGEERRIAYVALSRAKDTISVSSHWKPSVFFNLIPKEIVDGYTPPQPKAEAGTEVTSDRAVIQGDRFKLRPILENNRNSKSQDLS